MNNQSPRKTPRLRDLILAAAVIIGILASMCVYSFNLVRRQSLHNAVLSNLRIIASGADQFMAEKSRTQATYRDLADPGNNYVRSVAPVAGEDYSGLTVAKSQTQISISSAALGTVTFHL